MTCRYSPSCFTCPKRGCVVSANVAKWTNRLPTDTPPTDMRRARK